jgi:hypothetical protein
MGDYADDYYRKEVKNTFGFDPGSMYLELIVKPKLKCGKCGKRFMSEISVKQHLRDYHKIKEYSVQFNELAK